MEERSQLPGILGGLVLTLGLHAAAALAVLLVAAVFSASRPASEAGLAVVFVFVAGLALWQWVYLAPVAWLAGRAGFAGLAKGLWIGGASGVVLSGVLYFGAVGTRLVGRALPERPAPTPDSRSVAVKGTVESFDGTALVVRTDAGLLRLRVRPSTDYILLTAPAGHRREGPGAVTPGARVSIAAWKDGADLDATMVRVVEPGRDVP